MKNTISSSQIVCCYGDDTAFNRGVGWKKYWGKNITRVTVTAVVRSYPVGGGKKQTFCLTASSLAKSPALTNRKIIVNFFVSNVTRKENFKTNLNLERTIAQLCAVFIY